MKNKFLFIGLFLFLTVKTFTQDKTATIAIENAIVGVDHYTFEIHLTQTNDWGNVIQDALGDCSWYFNINGNALNNPTITYVATELGSGNGYTNETGIPTTNKLQVTTYLDFPTYLGYPLTPSTDYHLYTIQLDIIESTQTTELSWDQVNTGIFNASEEEIIETYVGGDDSALPVELTNFTAASAEANVTLNWQTATEVDNYGFEIERKLMEGDWENIGFVDGSGNSYSPKSYSFTDSKITGGSIFYYRLKQLDNDGTSTYSDEVEVKIVPTEYTLYQNYPNPFNPSTKIRFSIVEKQQVDLRLYNAIGEEVLVLAQNEFDVGYHVLEFRANDLAGGIYFYRIVAGNFVETKKMILLK